MTWLLRRFPGFGRARGALVCYLRENGPIAYASGVFGKDPRERAGALLATDLAWYWRTVASVGVREWTRLTAWSLAALLADVGETSGAVPAALVLIGVDVHAAVFLEVNKPKPVVLFELAKGWLTGDRVEPGETHELRAPHRRA